jgi:tetratricopeptide (TPR) repeat protein
MNVLLACALLGALQDASARGGRVPIGAPTPADMLEDEIAAQSESVVVKLVSKEGDPPAFDVIAHGAPAHEVLARLAQAAGRVLKLDSSEAVLRSNEPVDVHLKHRSLRESALWIAGSAGLTADLDANRRDLRCGADVPDKIPPETLLSRAIDGWRSALLADPLQPDAARLRFQIANALYELGDYARAIVEYSELEKSAPTFGDLAFVYFRCGFAYAKLGDDNAAQAQWTSIASIAPRHPLVAAARLEAVRAFRRMARDPHLAPPDAAAATAHANTILRSVVEAMNEGLSPADLVTSGELLDEGGDHRGAIKAMQWALQATSDAELEQRALLGLARAQTGCEDWPGVVATADRFVRAKGDVPAAAEVEYLLARAHHAMGDDFTALLAVARARELKPGSDLVLRCDLLEGNIHAACGLSARAQKSLARATAADDPEVAAQALLLSAELLCDDGQLESAARLLARLAALEGHETEGAIALADIALRQRNNELCLQRVKDALPAADAAGRAKLLDIAAQALRDGDSIDSLLEGLNAKPDADASAKPAPEAPNKPAAEPAKRPAAEPAKPAGNAGGGPKEERRDG